MVITFDNGATQQVIDADKHEAAVLEIGMRHMLAPECFDMMDINLGDEGEEVACYNLDATRQVASWGGAAAWHIYRQIAVLFPEIGENAQQFTVADLFLDLVHSARGKGHAVD